MKHKHDWKYLARGTGSYSKRNETKDAIFVDGHAEVCNGCPKQRFVPDNPKLKIVEIDNDNR